jgi:TRAP-type C4-dicarboxylate transport system permease small subunit
LLLRALSTTFLLIGIAGIFLRNADADVIAILGWSMIVVGFAGQVFFGLIYFFFARDD